MAIDFPAAPTAGAEHTDPASGVTFVWNGTGWTIKASGGTTGDFVLKTGDTMSGVLTISMPQAVLNLEKTVASNANQINGIYNSALRWSMNFGNNTPETGSSSGSNFNINRYDDTGILLDTPLSIERATGIVACGSTQWAAAAKDVVTKDYIDNAIQPQFGSYVLKTGDTMSGDLTLPNLRFAIGGSLVADGNLVITTGAAGGLYSRANTHAISSLDGASNFADFSGLGLNVTGNVVASNEVRAAAGITGLTLDALSHAHVGGATPSIGIGILPFTSPGWAGSAELGVSVTAGCLHVARAAPGPASAISLSGDGPATAYMHWAIQCGSVSVAQNITYFNTTSDANLKDDLKSFDAGNIIDATEVYDFAWKDTGERSYGVIAQEAINVYPDAVTHQVIPDQDEWWGIDYSKYVPVLLQELKAVRERLRELEQMAGIKPPTIDPKARS